MEFLIKCELTDVKLVVTRSPKPAGRSLKLTPTEIATWLSKNFPEIESAEIDNLKGNRELLSRVEKIKPDIFIANSFGRIIPNEFLELVKYPLCVHPSPLPLLRGPSPIRTTLMLGMQRTAVTLFKMVQEMDAGDILLLKEAEVYQDDNFSILRKRLANLAVDVVAEGLKLILNDRVTLTPQDHSKATFTKLISYEDTFIDFSQSAQDVVNKIRAFSPDMGAVCMLPDGTNLKLFRAHVMVDDQLLEKRESQPGEVVEILRESFIVACGAGFIEVLEVQPANRRVMSAKEFLTGRKVKCGDILRLPAH